jgi:hypothetical protein
MRAREPDRCGYAGRSGERVYWALVADAVAVLDATDTAAGVCVGLSMGRRVLLQLATGYPHRVTRAVFVAPTMYWDEELPARRVQPFDAPCVNDVGWGRNNAEYWRCDLVGVSTAQMLATQLDGEVEVMTGGGHCVQARHPVRSNLTLRGFVESVGV